MLLFPLVHEDVNEIKTDKIKREIRKHLYIMFKIRVHLDFLKYNIPGDNYEKNI